MALRGEGGTSSPVPKTGNQANHRNDQQMSQRIEDSTCLSDSRWLTGVGARAQTPVHAGTSRVRRSRRWLASAAKMAAIFTS